MKNREEIVKRLGHILFVAARNQVAKGAIYDPAEDLTPKDPEKVWAGVAESLVNIVETALKDGREVERGEG